MKLHLYLMLILINNYPFPNFDGHIIVYGELLLSSRNTVYNNGLLQPNLTEKGRYLGSPCELKCHPSLRHVICNHIDNQCECEKKYPVKLSPDIGCAKPKQLGEQCYYKETCQYTDEHSTCVQIQNNAICQCKLGYHYVSIEKPSKRIFCAEDLVGLKTNFSTFAGVLSGIAILSGLLCFVLHLFNQNMYGSRRHRYGNANLPPPILFSTDPGVLPLPIIDRSLLLTSCTSSHRTLASLPSRRASSGQGCRRIIINTSRSGSRHPSLASIHSGSSIRSFSAQRFEQERERKEEREMQKRLAKMTASMQNNHHPMTPTPSPHSTDDLLPPLEEDKQNEVPYWTGYRNLPPMLLQDEPTTNFRGDQPSTSKHFL